MLLWDHAAPLIVCYFLAALLIPLLVKYFRQRTFYIAALMPLSVLVWTLSHTREAFGTGSQEIAEFYQWSSALDLEIGFRLTGLSWLMLLVINLVGSLILVYCAQYFSKDSPRLGQFIAAFLGFAASMSGLVLADHTMTLYFFWEITTFSSFILIGHEAEERASRAAARQAILVTTTGSLSMFAGFVILGIMPGGSFRISDLLTVLSSPTALGTQVEPVAAGCGLALILFAAVTKSAIFPTHFWLPFRDGRSHSGFGVPTRGRHGKSGDLPNRPVCARICPLPRTYLGNHYFRGNDNAARRLRGVATNRP